MVAYINQDTEYSYGPVWPIYQQVRTETTQSVAFQPKYNDASIYIESDYDYEVDVIFELIA